MALVNKEFLKTRQLQRKIVRVEVPEWGEEAFVCVRELSARAQEEFEYMLVQMKEMAGSEDVKKFDNFRARYLVVACCDEDGNPIFDSEDIEMLGNQENLIISRIFNAAKDLNTVLVEALEKN